MTLPLQETTTRQPGKEKGMAEHPNATLVWRGYELFSAGDMAGFLELLADDVAWHVPGRCPLAGDYKGRQGVLGYFTTIDELSGGTYQISDVHDVVASDEHVVGLHHSVASRPGKAYDHNETIIFHVRDGLITEVWEVYGALYEIDEFWS
jgi:ketosteroid isomerase-like protein